MKRCYVASWCVAISLISLNVFAAEVKIAIDSKNQLALTQRTTVLTLEEAWRFASERNPALSAIRAGRIAAEGQVTESRAFLWNNPELSYGLNRHRLPDGTGSDIRYREWSAGLSQTLEIAGQRRYRANAANEDLAALDASIADSRIQLLAEVEERFAKVLSMQQRVTIETENVKLVENAANLLRKRVTAGESSRLDGNLAVVEAERTKNQLATAHEQLVAVQMELAQLLQLAPDASVEARGELVRARDYKVEDLIESVMQQPKLEALTKRENAARSRLDLERASTYPDVTVGLNMGRDGPADARDRIVGFSVSVPLPLFKRNQANIAKASSELTQSQIERQATERDLRAAVSAHWLRFQTLKARVERMRQSILPKMTDNLRLSQLAFQAGELGLTELLLVNRQILDVRRELLDAETELRLGQIALERVAGVVSGPAN